MLSIDPSSPFRGGALLGDRIRLTEHFLDPGVFIRSMATRGALGGLAEAALQTALLMDAAGKDDVFLETVGVGQAEVDVIDHADSVVLVLIPGSGDSIQALKAGVMEIPDIIVVNKSDHPLTDTMVREIRGVLVAGAAGGLAGPDPQDRGRARRGRRGAGREAAPSTARYVEAEGTLSERRRRNLMNEVLGIADDAAAARARGVAARRPRGAGAAGRGRGPPAGPGERRERGARARRGRPEAARPTRGEPFVQFALQAGRARPRVAACGGRSGRSPAPSALSRRWRPLPSRRRRTASSPRSRDGKLVTLNPDGSGLRTLWTRRRGARSPGSRGRRTATGSRSSTAGGSSSTTSRAGRVVRAHRRRRGDANPAWSADGTTIGFRRGLGAACRCAPAGGDGARSRCALDAARTTTSRSAPAPDLEAARARRRGPAGRLAGSSSPPRRRAARRRGRRTATRIAFADAPAGLSDRSPRPAATAPRRSPPAPAGRAALGAGRRRRCVYAAASELRTVAAARRRAARSCRGGAASAPADWQPCAPA